MSESEYTFSDYLTDKRMPCKYGRNCYQKNPTHLEKYKHPPPVKSKNQNGMCTASKPPEPANDELEHPAKKPRLETENGAQNSLNHKEFIKTNFLVDMPEDFYAFWDYCQSLDESNPTKALKSVGLTLVGPYDVLDGKFKNVQKTPEEFLVHWRYYYDPPEFQTVLKGDDKTGFHMGYFRDSPTENPAFVGSNCASKDGTITTMGDNIFAAVNTYLEDLKKSGDPFRKMNVPKVQTSLKKAAEDLDLSFLVKSPKIVERDRKVVTRTFNRAGLVVPYNRKTQQGYRELALSNKDLKNILTQLKMADPDKQKNLLSKLQPAITFAEIAMDECDFGTGVELGWDIMFFGVDTLNKTAMRFLANSYVLLNREAFAKIAEAHLSNRRSGCNLSVL